MHIEPISSERLTLIQVVIFHSDMSYTVEEHMAPTLESLVQEYTSGIPVRTNPCFYNLVFIRIYIYILTYRYIYMYTYINIYIYIYIYIYVYIYLHTYMFYIYLYVHTHVLAAPHHTRFAAVQVTKKATACCFTQLPAHTVKQEDTSSVPENSNPSSCILNPEPYSHTP